MSRNLASLIDQAAQVLSEAGCTPLARVRAAAGVMDMIFLTAHGARLLVRCSTRKANNSDLEALATMHQQRTFDHVVLLSDQARRKMDALAVVPFAELSSQAPALAGLRPGWAI